MISDHLCKGQIFNCCQAPTSHVPAIPEEAHLMDCRLGGHQVSLVESSHESSAPTAGWVMHYCALLLVLITSVRLR